MKRAALAIVSTVTALVMLLSFKTHTATSLATPPGAISTPSASPSASATAKSSTSAKKKATSTATKKAVTTKTVTGDSADTRYGPVQVQITVTNGQITSASAIDYPQGDSRDQEINAYAIPALNQEAVQAGSANIAHISGATYTSDGYIQSLQSALNKV
jgi:uncharacterized protein with FMN-binding domain